MSIRQVLIFTAVLAAWIGAATFIQRNHFPDARPDEWALSFMIPVACLLAAVIGGAILIGITALIDCLLPRKPKK
jgi:hypothetical protein